MDAPRTPRPHGRWVQRLIDEERAPALLMLAVAGIALGYATHAGASDAAAISTLGPAVMPLGHFAAEGLLVVFFFVAGLELRHELSVGSLNSVRAAAVPVIAAAAGMIAPALLFLSLAPTSARDAWGIPMATDLPLALALLGVAGRHLPPAFRAFLLSLAIVDDALSIVVVAITFGAHLSPQWIAVVSLLVGAYALVLPRSGWLAAALAVFAWMAMLQTGIHPTVLGVALGLATTRDVDGLRERWQPLSAFVAVPLFVGTSLLVPVDLSSIDPRLTWALTVARIVGKPLGITVGAVLAVRLIRPADPLPLRLYAVAGSTAGLGFSVSVLFADLAMQDAALAAAKLAILIALAVSTAVGALALRLSRA